ncbi:hypothetical protein C8J57DRAFT_1519646 [Mycena rebaudengoi]|nr:hypothetical protein C8J57DRAFT_1519646 [Mycena rebaudengoi]
MSGICDDAYDPRGAVRGALAHIRALRARRRRPSRWRTPSRQFVTCPAISVFTLRSRARPRSSQTLDLVAPGPRHQRLGALRALTAFGSSGAGSDAMHWVERDVLSLPMPSFDDDIREDYRHALMLQQAPAGGKCLLALIFCLGIFLTERLKQTVFHHQRERQKQAHFWEEVGAQWRKESTHRATMTFSPPAPAGVGGDGADPKSALS